MHPISTKGRWLLAAALALPACALAADAAPSEPARAALPDPQPAAARPRPEPFGAAAGNALLDGARGSGGTPIVTTLNGNVNGNSATHVATGNNLIQSGAFANMSGIPVVIQNSGANVLIQNATVINLQLK